MSITIRPIRETDNPVIAKIIRDTLAEFGANHAGTVYYDPSTDHLYELFQTPRATYNIALLDGEIVGGGGIYPTEGLAPDTCELVKMYLVPSGRGKGIGKMMIERCIDQAREMGYKNIYLETMNELRQALKIYEWMGFEYLSAPLGQSGHFGCPLWMLKKL